MSMILGQRFDLENEAKMHFIQQFARHASANDSPPIFASRKSVMLISTINDITSYARVEN